MPLKDFCEKYKLDQGNTQRFMSKNLDKAFKEQIGGRGKPWIVKEDKLKELIPKLNVK